MEKLFLTVACGDYDRTKSLQDGSVEPEGIKLNYVALQSEEIFWRMGHYREFDASEMSLSNHITMLGRGDSPFVGIPIFPSRFFRHSSVYYNVDSGIKKPQDFKGKKVGTPEYAMTAAVWIRGFFDDDHGVRAQDMKWFLGGQEEPGRKERVKLDLPPEISVQSIPDDRTLNSMLESGEIDALISVMVPSGFGKTVRRLFRDSRKVEVEYYRKTRIFPIMHTLVLKADLYKEKPWLALSFYRAFCRARDLAHASMYDTDALTVSLPWIVDEVEETRRLFGRQIWDYSIEGSLPTLNALLTYLDEQKLSQRRMNVDELFVANINPGLADYLRATGEA